VSLPHKSAPNNFLVGFLTPVASLRRKDVELCRIAVMRARAEDKLGRGVRLMLVFLGGMRRWIFLPVMCCVAPTLVLWRGGDALSVRSNALCTLHVLC
jgi:hypothetical protein